MERKGAAKRHNYRNIGWKNKNKYRTSLNFSKFLHLAYEIKEKKEIILQINLGPLQQPFQLELTFLF